jgi:hypothetical protein
MLLEGKAAAHDVQRPQVSDEEVIKLLERN